MAVGVIMPRQGQSVESCIIEWKVSQGDKVSSGDVLFAYETDKASFEEESTASGTVLKLFAEDGDDVPCLDYVCVIGNQGEDISEFLPQEKESEEQAEQESAITNSQDFAPEITAKNTDESKISPRAKNIADNQSLDVTKAMATGPGGRIIERDILELSKKAVKITEAKKDYIGGKTGTGIGGTVTTADLSSHDSSETADAQYTDVKLSNVRKAIAKSMRASLTNMAPLTINASFDASTILEFRSKIKANMQSMSLPNITLNDLILFTVAKTLKKHADMNAHYQQDKIRKFSAVNLGMAVDTDRGLLVPTIFRADSLTLSELCEKTKELAAGAQSGRISPDLLSGGTFTVTNLGALGVESFSPIINPPQTGILGVCSISYRHKKKDGEIVSYPAMGLSLTFDHRAVDGAPAARFLKDLCESLENFNLTLAIAGGI